MQARGNRAKVKRKNTKRPFVLLIFLSPLLIGGRASEARAGGQQTLRHFYVYDECYKPIAHVQYVPVGQNSVIRADIDVAPGNQRLVAVEGVDSPHGKGSIVGSATSKDGALHWATRTIPSSIPEFTYVIARKCDPADSNCTLPDRWPYDTIRQYPGLGPWVTKAGGQLIVSGKYADDGLSSSPFMDGRIGV